jgi:hypothetical protein
VPDSWASTVNEKNNNIDTSKFTERISPPLAVRDYFSSGVTISTGSNRQLPFINFKKLFPPGAGGWEELLDEI